jgi:transposase
MDTTPSRTAYPGDVSDEEWAFVAPYLILMTPDAPQRDHDLREVFNGRRWIVRTGSPWRELPHDLPPWHTVYQQTQRWLRAGVFEQVVADLRVLIRLGDGTAAQPTAASFDIAQRAPDAAGHAGERPARGL